MTVKDLKVSQFIAGFWRLNQWQFNDAELHTYIEGLLNLGVTTMDHAFVYRSESQFGRVLKNTHGLREQMQLITKFGICPAGFGDPDAQEVNHYDSSSDYIIRSVENSLLSLCTDHIDVLLVHRPDYLMQAEELAKAFDHLKSAGKVKHFGVSNFSAFQFRLLQSFCDTPFSNKLN